MSMVICEHCDTPIDSDDDPGCFCMPPDGMCTPAQQQALTTILCEPCRESAYDRQQEALASEPPPSMNELHQRAWAEKRSLKN